MSKHMPTKSREIRRRARRRYACTLRGLTSLRWPVASVFGGKRRGHIVPRTRHKTVIPFVTGQAAKSTVPHRAKSTRARPAPSRAFVPDIRSRLKWRGTLHDGPHPRRATGHPRCNRKAYPAQIAPPPVPAAPAQASGNGRRPHLRGSTQKYHPTAAPPEVLHVSLRPPRAIVSRCQHWVGSLRPGAESLLFSDWRAPPP